MNNLGKQGKDLITGFEGTITSAHYYLTGCTQYGLQPKVKGDGSLGEIMFFDENRLIISGEKIEIKKAEKKTNISQENGCDSRESP
jgi:hypothetical protein